MPKDKEKSLKKLQEEKQLLISKIKNESIAEIKEKYNQKIQHIKDEMTNLNKLEDNEKNIHAIWIGILKKGGFDNLKVWAKYNREYKIHIWTDSTHILSNKLNNIIFENSKLISNGIKEHNYQLEADLKDDFYNNYQLKNPTKTFDQNVKQFLLHKKYATEKQIIRWIKSNKKKIIQEQKDIKKYTSNEVILHDINQEKDSIFPSKQYYEGYLKTLEHLHLCAGSSDRLRYAILDKFGGAYIDIDLIINFNLTRIKNNKETMKLINSIKCDNTYNNFSKAIKKPELIINQITVLDNLNQLNNENLKDFTKKWEKIFNSDFNKTFQTFKKIALNFKNLNLKPEPIIQLSEFPIDNFLQTSCYNQGKIVSNSFIISKKNSKFLQNVMKKIQLTDEKIKDMNTYTKLINKNQMIIYHTGSANIAITLLENDENHFYQNKKNNLKPVSLDTIDNYDSNWFNKIYHKEIIYDHNQLKSLFLANINEEKKKLKE